MNDFELKLHEVKERISFWRGFYLGMTLMGLFAIFVFVMVFIIGGNIKA